MGPSKPVSWSAARTARISTSPNVVGCGASWDCRGAGVRALRQCAKWMRPRAPRARAIAGRSFAGSAPNDPVQNVTPFAGRSTSIVTRSSAAPLVTLRGRRHHRLQKVREVLPQALLAHVAVGGEQRGELRRRVGGRPTGKVAGP